MRERHPLHDRRRLHLRPRYEHERHLADTAGDGLSRESSAFADWAGTRSHHPIQSTKSRIILAVNPQMFSPWKS
jgi:hypothetical protein